MTMICEECGSPLEDCSCVESVMGICHAVKDGEGSYCGSRGPTTDDAQRVNCEECQLAIKKEIDNHCVHCGSEVEHQLVAEDEVGDSRVMAKYCPKCGYIDAWNENDRL